MAPKSDRPTKKPTVEESSNPQASSKELSNQAPINAVTTNTNSATSLLPDKSITQKFVPDLESLPVKRTPGKPPAPVFSKRWADERQAWLADEKARQEGETLVTPKAKEVAPVIQNLNIRSKVTAGKTPAHATAEPFNQENLYLEKLSVPSESTASTSGTKSIMPMRPVGGASFNESFDSSSIYASTPGEAQNHPDLERGTAAPVEKTIPVTAKSTVDRSKPGGTHNKSLVFGKSFDIANAHQMRALMNYLIWRCSGSSHELAIMKGITKSMELKGDEAKQAKEMHELKAKSPILDRMLENFASSRYRSAYAVVKVARSLDGAVIEALMNPNARPSHEYNMAVEHFRRLEEEEKLSYRQEGISESGEIDTTRDEELRDQRLIASKHRYAARKAKPHMGPSTLLEAPSSGSVGEGSCNAQSKKRKKCVTTLTQDFKDKHRPIKVKGEVLRDPTAYEEVRALRAKVGPPQPELLIIKLYTFKPSDEDKSKMVENELVMKYMKDDDKEMTDEDWLDQARIKAINAWRFQVFYRWEIGTSANARLPWTLSEQTALFELLEDHLSNRPGVNGRLSRVAWGEIADELWKRFEGKTHPAGEMTAATTYLLKGVAKITKSKMLMKPRPAIQRKSGALENQMGHFIDPRAKMIMAAARQADREQNPHRHSGLTVHSPSTAVGQDQSGHTDDTIVDAHYFEDAENLEVTKEGNEESQDEEMADVVHQDIYEFNNEEEDSLEQEPQGDLDEMDNISPPRKRNRLV